LYQFYWDTTISGQRGQYGYYRVRTNRIIPERGFLEVGKVATNAVQLFVQDSWTISQKLTLNYGLRTENEVMPSYADPTYGFNPEAFEFTFGDKIAPRVGFAWDVKSDGRWKTYDSWGIFYDILKLDLARSSFGGAKWTEYYFSLDTPNWPSLIDVPGCPPACPGNQLLPTSATLERGDRPRHPADEAAGACRGVEHELSPTLSVAPAMSTQAGRLRHRGASATWTPRATRSTIGNPGEGLATNAYVFPTASPVPFLKAQRDYDSVEFTLNCRMADRWSARSGMGAALRQPPASRSPTRTAA
jgi:hypothetical protein